MLYLNMRKLISKIPNSLMVILLMIMCYWILPRIVFPFIFKKFFNVFPELIPVTGVLLIPILILIFILLVSLVFWGIFKIFFLIPSWVFDIKFLSGKKVAIVLYVIVFWVLFKYWALPFFMTFWEYYFPN